MKFLVIFLLLADLLCGYFLYTDAPGSGMGKAVVILTLLLACVLLYNRFFGAGTWLGDEANGR